MFLKDLVCLITVIKVIGADFQSPEVILEAYSPKGFRASIPALDGIQMFAFHGNLNKEISQVDPGEFSGDFTKPTGNNVWSYYNEDLVLKRGDIIHYWTFIQYNKLGYRKDAQQWTVSELVTAQNTTCENSASLVAKKALICKNSVILDEKFNSQTQIDEQKWFVEEFIPYFSEDFEFNSYQKKVCYVQGNRLFIKPKPAVDENDVRGELDLRNTCTRSNPDECYLRQQLAFILPPVISGRIYSRLNFRYGKIEIKAKLPAGDWMYPQIFLEQVSDPSKKIWIAYSRGNVHLYASNNQDIGGHLLFGGPVVASEEPDRSTHLKSTSSSSEPFSSKTHTFGVIWTKDDISLLLDGTLYGKIDKEEMQQINFAENDMVRIVLGVGIGGVNDFPDDFRSGNSLDDKKPWKNKERAQVKKFFDAREQWLKSWTGDNAALQIEYVRVVAL